jgi:hypothetical protein
VNLKKTSYAVINKFRNMERVRDVLNPMKNAAVESLLPGYTRKLIELHNV